MEFFKIDLSSEAAQIKTMAGEIIDEKVAPMVRDAISQAGSEFGDLVVRASGELQTNIKVLSEEIHNQRRLTKDDITILIDYAAERIGKTIDERIAAAKEEASTLITEKIAHIRLELEDAAIRGRKTLWANIVFSVGAAVAMAAVGVVYRKITLGELDVFWLFRVLLLSAATGTGLFGALKMLNQWRAMNRSKKNAVTIALTYLGVARPNGAAGLFLVSLLLVAAWFILAFYVH